MVMQLVVLEIPMIKNAYKVNLQKGFQRKDEDFFFPLKSGLLRNLKCSRSLIFNRIFNSSEDAIVHVINQRTMYNGRSKHIRHFSSLKLNLINSLKKIEIGRHFYRRPGHPHFPLSVAKLADKKIFYSLNLLKTRE